MSTYLAVSIDKMWLQWALPNDNYELYFHTFNLASFYCTAVLLDIGCWQTCPRCALVKLARVALSSKDAATGSTAATCHRILTCGFARATAPSAVFRYVSVLVASLFCFWFWLWLSLWHWLWLCRVTLLPKCWTNIVSFPWLFFYNNKEKKRRLSSYAYVNTHQAGPSALTPPTVLPTLCLVSCHSTTSCVCLLLRCQAVKFL